MIKLKIKLENCYGIKMLEYIFDFNNKNTFVIYAPNGVMKTSFAKTLKDLSIGQKPHDQVDQSLIPCYNIIDDSNNTQLSSDYICVIDSYDESAFNSEETILTLLANDISRNKYLQIYNEIELVKKPIITQLKKISGSSNCELELIDTFSYLNKKNIYEILDSIKEKINSSLIEINFAYGDVFDKGGKVKSFLADNYDLVQEYISTYSSLINGSKFFGQNSKGIFGTTEASEIIKALDSDLFFLVGHKLFLNSYGEINDSQKIKEIYSNEISQIFDNDQLKELFDKIEKKLTANKDLINFKKVIEKDNSLLLKLSDYEGFRRDVWYSFLKQIKESVSNLITLYNDKKNELQAIIKEANNEIGLWEQAIQEYENRFHTPFKMKILNKSDAILNNQAPAIDFEFRGRSVERKKLVDKILSQGEKRAFYILNIIFKIKSRQRLSQKTLYIIDDIADSFDYKNKYAIIEYLRDLKDDNNNYNIILTHNFDFYRTVGSRLSIVRENKLHAIKKNDKIELIQEVYQNPPFKTWSKNLKENSTYTLEKAKRHIIALIPFVRNLIEYGGFKDENSTGIDKDYNILTSLLHIKPNTNIITFGNLKLIYKRYINTDDFDSTINVSDLVYDCILTLMPNIRDYEFNLENKIVLSIGIRLLAEEYIWSKINDKSDIAENQTGILFQRYKKEFITDSTFQNNIRVLESVCIMTPENIHINSFMYEPILDMGIDELNHLYHKVISLT